MIIFIAGIHGVGKTYLSVLTAQQLEVIHATASQLIREERGMQSWTSNKQSDDVAENQSALISAVGRIKASHQNMLLDGHFVIRGDNNTYIPIDTNVFRDLNVDAVLLLETDDEIVFDRLTARGDCSWSIEELASFADGETIHANQVSKTLEIPLYLLRSPSLSRFKDMVESILKSAVI